MTSMPLQPVMLSGYPSALDVLAREQQAPGGFTSTPC